MKHCLHRHLHIIHSEQALTPGYDHQELVTTTFLGCRCNQKFKHVQRATVAPQPLHGSVAVTGDGSNY